MSETAPPPGAYWALAAAALGEAAALLASQSVTFGLADIRGGIGAGFDEGAWLATAYTIGELTIVPLTALFCTAFGTRPYLVTQILLFSAATIACSLASSPEMLVVCRLMQGITGGALTPLAFRLTLQNFHGSYRPFGITVFATAATLAPQLAGVVSGWAYAGFGWRAVFLPPLLLLALALPCALRGVAREPSRASALRDGDWPGWVLGAGGCVALACAFDQGERLDWFSSPLIVVLLLLASLLLPLFVLRQLTAERPLVQLGLLAWPQFALPLALNGFFRLSLLGTAIVYPSYLAAVHGLRMPEAGTVLLWIASAQIVFVPMILSLAARVDERLILTTGLALFLAGSMISAQLTSVAERPELVPGGILQGLGQSMIIVPLIVIATSRVTPAEAGSAGVLFNQLRSLTSSIAAGLVSWFVVFREHGHSARLVENVRADTPWYLDRLHHLGGQLGDAASAGASFTTRNLAVLMSEVRTQANVLAYNDVSLAIGATVFAAIVIVWLIPPPPRGSGLWTWTRYCGSMAEQHRSGRFAPR